MNLLERYKLSYILLPTPTEIPVVKKKAGRRPSVYRIKDLPDNILNNLEEE